MLLFIDIVHGCEIDLINSSLVQSRHVFCVLYYKNTKVSLNLDLSYILELRVQKKGSIL